MNRSVVVCLAFAADPNLGSEAGAGAALVRSAAEFAATQGFGLVVYTRTKHSADVQQMLSRGVGEIRVIGVDGWKSKALGSSMGFRLESLVWQARVWVRVRRLTRENSVAAIHHMTMASDAMPGAVHFLSRTKVRTIWGPVGSSSVALNTGQSWQSRSLRVLKSLWFTALARRVSVVVSQTDWVAKQLIGGRVSSFVEQNCSVDDEVVTSVRATRMLTPNHGDRVIVVGELIERKRPRLACMAAEYLPITTEMVFVGDGPLRDTLEESFAPLVASGRIKFTGKIPRQEVLHLLAKSSLLLHLASREGAGWVVAESLACGTQVVAVDGSVADCLVRKVLYGGEVVSDSVANDPRALANVINGLVSNSQNPAYAGQWSEARFVRLMGDWYRP